MLHGPCAFLTNFVRLHLVLSVLTDVVLIFDLIQHIIRFNTICNLISLNISIIIGTFKLSISTDCDSMIIVSGIQSLANNTIFNFQIHFDCNLKKGFQGTEIISKYCFRCDVYCFKIIKFQFLTKDYG